ncbi:MAG: M42 family peptidase, partial [Solirubrobacterales bacterium]|nr:M42 family peptidase [Solirubrobacterales bacterium]
MTTTPALLDELLRTPGPSGYEAPAAEVWRKAASFAEISTDGLGSSVATIPSSDENDDAPLLAVVGHIDEIGL